MARTTLSKNGGDINIETVNSDVVAALAVLGTKLQPHTIADVDGLPAALSGLSDGVAAINARRFETLDAIRDTDLTGPVIGPRGETWTPSTATVFMPSADDGFVKIVGEDGRLWSMQYNEFPKIEFFGADPTGQECCAAIVNGLGAKGYPVHGGDGTYVALTDEFYFGVPGQIMTGMGGGQINVAGTEIEGARTRFIVKHTSAIPRYRKTRRMHPVTSSDDDDAPLSTLINNQSERGWFANFALELACDYSDLSPTNFGADCDVGFFNGCRTATHLINVTILGHFRVANEYWDVTGSTSLPAHKRPDGSEFPDYHTNGADQCRSINNRSLGAYWNVVVQGREIREGATTYYDYMSELTVSGNGGRGGSGTSDFMATGNYWRNQHQSLQRPRDPAFDTSVDNFMNCCGNVSIDGNRGSSVQARIRALYFANNRCVSMAGARFLCSDVSEVRFNWNHTEPAKGTAADNNIIYNSSGVAIKKANYEDGGEGDPITSYGPLAIRPTSGIGGGGINIIAEDFLGTGVIAKWTKDVSPTFREIKDSYEVATWTPVFHFENEATITIVSASGTSHKQDKIVRHTFEIQYYGMDLTDESPITFGGLLYAVDSDGVVTGKIDYQASDGLAKTKVLTFARTAVNDTYIALVDEFGDAETYDGGVIGSGTLENPVTIKGVFEYVTSEE